VVWKFSAIIEATAQDAERAAEAMQRALCPDENHDGPCEVPWTMMQCRFEDLDDERVMWEEDFANDRRLFQEAVDFANPERNVDYSSRTAALLAGQPQPLRALCVNANGRLLPDWATAQPVRPEP